jgi:hypothetical protein
MTSFKGKTIISTEEIHKKLVEAEEMTKERKNKKHKNRHHQGKINVKMDNEDTEDDSNDEQAKIGECIEVQFE